MRHRIALSWIAAFGCTAPHPAAPIDRAIAAPTDASRAGDAAPASLFADCHRTLAEDTAVRGIDVACGDYLIIDLWVLPGRPTCTDQCLIDSVLHMASSEGARVAVEHPTIVGAANATLLVSMKPDQTAWDLFAFVTPRRSVTCERAWLEHATPEAGAQIVATCVATLGEWIAVDRPDVEQCERVTDHMLAFPDAARNLRDAIISNCLAGTRASADCALAATTFTAAIACTPG